MAQQMLFRDHAGADPVRELMHAWARGDLGRLADRFDDDVVLTSPAGTLVGRADAERHLAGIAAALPDLRGHVLRWSWHSDDALEVHMLYTATVAGRVMSWRGIDRYRFLDGLIVEKVSDYDHGKIRRRLLLSPRGWSQLLRAGRVQRELGAQHLAPLRCSPQERIA